MSTPVYMSHEHIEQMNDLLARSDEVAAACAELDRDYVIAYELGDGPGGTVFWVLSFDRITGARFSLDEPAHADVTFAGDWRRLVRAGQAHRQGTEVDPAVEVRGDPGVLDAVSPAMAVARRAATVDVEFPEV
ncbi:hypothetical protein ACFWYW_29585 [Nonomuraea sp. NPDC059023]|uniref:hypothetical protein n=1 Tax=unclassified Nonomuraea TaxID=2593643 RepID=UPI0036830CA7